ncbi:hypothetical protein SAMN05216271_1096 [Halopseudomonas sabulinigri]|uniref:DUF7079 domain-containing protein n=1 Tax=Halopseudomonas sabulinigri TaxID=472181 RepID=A0A1H1P8I1_9GAMM|nr:hypothetical protein SAMN05216271_1096 [Halopseudomonas sabulinigri]
MPGKQALPPPDAARVALWAAFSELFLDTDISADTHRFVARRIIESGLPPETVLQVLWLEVFPALCDNLRVVAGEWAGFNDEWLSERVASIAAGEVNAYAPFALVTVNQVIKAIETQWELCAACLPASYRDLRRPSNQQIKRLGVIGRVTARD